LDIKNRSLAAEKLMGNAVVTSVRKL